MALQFHLEATHAGIASWLAEGNVRIGCGQYEQQPEALVERPERFRAMEPLLFNLLDRFIAAR